ncbi:CitMHS family transporter [Niveispirillum fermenti]|uniref:CitMHS family transporter n=1 Tax=Niveispirillum fermenti TaxID=1233113 RepID=UPI003A8B70C8
MIALLGFSTISLFTILVMTNRVSAVAGLIGIPIIFAVLAGFGTEIGKMMVGGIVQTAPTAVMLVFALLYFIVMFESGLFEPFIRKIIGVVGDDPVKIVIGTALLVIITGFDGDGATAVLITITAMYPIYRRVGINPLIIALMLGLICPVLNWLPWGGPAARAAIALKVDIDDIVGPMIPALLLSLLATLGLAYHLGLREKRRLAQLAVTGIAAGGEGGSHLKPRKIIQPRNFWFNLILTICLMAGMGLGIAPLPALVMLAFAVAVTVNMPNVREQQERLKEHGATVMTLVTLMLAAGAFTGIIGDTGMVKAMADTMIAAVPDGLGEYFGFVTAVISMPLLVILSTDGFFLGVLPILAHTGAAYGVPPEVVARAALIGMPCHSLSPLIAPIYFCASLLRTDIGTLQRFAWPWAIWLCFVALFAATITGAVHAA